MSGPGGRLPDAGIPVPESTALSSTETAEVFLAENGQKQSGKLTRREEIGQMLANQNKDPLSERDRKEIGAWLRSRFSRLTAAHSSGSAEGITKEDIVESYSSAKWHDKSKFLWSDMRMLQRVARQFDTLALGGGAADELEKADVETVIKGGRVQRTARDVTTNFPDGSLERRTKGGDLFKKGADGSLSVQAATLQLELAANGSGYLRYRVPAIFNSPSRDAEIKLTKGADGVWLGKDKDGEDFELAVDEHSVRMRTPDTDMLLTSNGGYFRDPNDADSAMFINTDGSVTMSENGKIATIAVNPESGIRMAKERDGSFIIEYPFRSNYWKNADGEIGISGKGRLPNINVAADGTLTVRDDDGKTELPIKTLADGTRETTTTSGMKVSFDKGGKFTFTIPVDPSDPTINVTLELEAAGTFTIRAPGRDPIELKPPTIKY